MQNNNVTSPYNSRMLAKKNLIASITKASDSPLEIKTFEISSDQPLPEITFEAARHYFSDFQKFVTFCCSKPNCCVLNEQK